MNTFDSSQGLVLFGTGSSAAVALQEIQRRGFEVLYAVDNDTKKWGADFFGLEIRPPTLTSSLVLIATEAARTVAHQLVALGNRYSYIGPFFNYNQWDAYFTKISARDLRYLKRLFTDQHSLKVLEGIVKFRESLDPVDLVSSDFNQYRHPIVRVARGDCVIDAGAWTGDSAESFSKDVGSVGQVLCFEPDEDAQTQIPSRHNVRVIAAALSDFSGEGILQQPEPLWDGANRSGGMLVGDKSGSGKAVECVTLDELELQACSAIKMDIEGSEGAAIRGAQVTIRRFRPQLMISAYHRFDDLYVLPRQISEIAPYRFFLGHHSEAVIETVLYGDPQ